MSRKVGGREATTGVIPGEYCLSVGRPNIQPPAGWSWKPLSELARLESGHTPSRRMPEYWGGDVPWIGIKDATRNHGTKIHDTLQKTNGLGIANSAARILPENTVCLSRTASVGYVVVMGRPMATSQDFANWVCGPDLDYRFLKYALMLENGALHRFSHGSTHRTIYYPELKAFYLCVPERSEQERITDCLQMLDDKIELNLKTAGTLENMAEALYRAWFLDFEPVWAKSEGRQPSQMGAEIAGLFPDTFESNGIPVGWRLANLSDVFDVTMGQSPPGNTYNDRGNGLPFFQGCSDFGVRYPATRIFCSAPNRVADSESVLLSVRAPVGELNKARDRCCIGRGIAALTEKHRRSAFAFYALASLADSFETFEGDGTVFGSINRKQLEQLKLVIAPDSIRDAYESIAGPIDGEIRNLYLSAETLIELRNVLMTKLMSGQIRMSEIPQEIEKAA